MRSKWHRIFSLITNGGNYKEFGDSLPIFMEDIKYRNVTIIGIYFRISRKIVFIQLYFLKFLFLTSVLGT